jgi:uncharacterized protein (TIGR00661 family)
LNKPLRILVAPLNWGLGHATRCIPIIDGLRSLGAEVMLASDGRALTLLREEYPELPTFELPGYNITYGGSSMTWNIARQLPKISTAILSERRRIKLLVEQYKIDVIISDNRYGCRNKKCKNIFITHQINIAVPNPRLEILTNAINQQFINRFEECWIPDFEGRRSLAGKLSDGRLTDRYIGPLSRFKEMSVNKKYDIIAVLSGPEPQRSILEEKLIQQLSALRTKSLIVQGKTEVNIEEQITENLKCISFLPTHALNEAMLTSELIIARSGYSTIMDLVALGKKALLIPTPGQTEQEYLAEKLLEKKLFYFQKQEALSIEKALVAVEQFPGFKKLKIETDLLQKALHDLCNISP